MYFSKEWHHARHHHILRHIWSEQQDPHCSYIAHFWQNITASYSASGSANGKWRVLGEGLFMSLICDFQYASASIERTSHQKNCTICISFHIFSLSSFFYQVTCNLIYPQEVCKAVLYLIILLLRLQHSVTRLANWQTPFLLWLSLTCLAILRAANGHFREWYLFPRKEKIVIKRTLWKNTVAVTMFWFVSNLNRAY